VSLLPVRLDHLVLTVGDVAATCAWYERVLGMEAIVFGAGRTALRFGAQKINLHMTGAEIAPHATYPLPGSADLCFVTETPLGEVADHLATCDVAVLLGPVERTGATGALMSLYCRDPDGNLIEISNLIDNLQQT